jgi:hypothetical protein
LNSLIFTVLRFPMIPAIKKLLDWSGVPCGPALPPRRCLTAAEEASLREQIEAAGFDPCSFPA